MKTYIKPEIEEIKFSTDVIATETPSGEGMEDAPET